MKVRVQSFARASASLRCAVAVSPLVVCAAAFAQTSQPITDGSDREQAKPLARSAPATSKEGVIAEEVVVTGTLLRGVAPVGSSVIGVSSEEVAATGAATANDVLTSLPQVANYFNSLPAPASGVLGSNFRTPINRPNLRNLPGGNTSGGPQTLILLDGHRVVGVGIGQLAVDPDFITPSLIERVETITDGGSAVYGSDAVGGVINFITRRRFDGLQTDAHYGIGDDYQSYDASITTGRDWGAGSAFFGYTYAEHASLTGGDRGYAKSIDWATGIPIGRQCDLANVVVSNVSYRAQDPSLPGFNSCDPSDDGTFYPEGRSHNAFVGFSHDFSDSIALDLRGFYAHRDNENNAGPFRGTVTINPANPYYRPVTAAGVSPTASQTIQFSYGPALGDDVVTQQTIMESWNVTPTVTFDLVGSWQLRAMFNYGESHTSFANREINTTLQANAAAGTTLATALNPYNIAATQNQALLNDITSYVNRGDGRNEFLNYRAIADGGVFALPGGDVHVAIGAEYARNAFASRVTNATTRRLNPYAAYSQDVKSVFGELLVPIVGKSNSLPGVHGLSLSASARYDEYNDFGDTLNPKFGVTYEPLEWIAIRGSWGQSFNAPTPPDRIGAINTTLRNLNMVASLPPGVVVTPSPTNTVLILNGTVADLEPQEADTWSVGFTITPPVVPGLTIDLSYYDIDYKNIIGAPQNGTDSAAYYRDFPELTTVFPTLAQAQAFGALAPGGVTIVNAAIASGQTIVTLLDQRVRNIGDVKLSGIDFAINYSRPTGFGAIDAGLSGNYQLTQDSKVSPRAPTIDQLDTEQPRARAALKLGASIGNFRMQATLNHLEGYDLNPRTTLFNQTSVDSFDVVNLFFKYDVDVAGGELARDLSLTLNVNNVLDTDPPLLRDRSQFTWGYPNTMQTLGRFVQLGVSKKF